jgi:hypothetical protein
MNPESPPLHWRGVDPEPLIIKQYNIMWICDKCQYEYSAMLSDDEVPEMCECGGRVIEAEEDREDDGTLPES